MPPRLGSVSPRKTHLHFTFLHSRSTLNGRNEFLSFHSTYIFLIVNILIFFLPPATITYALSRSHPRMLGRELKYEKFVEEFYESGERSFYSARFVESKFQLPSLKTFFYIFLANLNSIKLKLFCIMLEMRARKREDETEIKNREG